MENDVNNPLKNKSDNNKEETTSLTGQSNQQEYSTIEKSVVINNQTTTFDLYKGFFYMFFSCFLKSLFAILCKILLNRNLSITSFHLLTFKVYVMLGMSIFVCLFFHYYRNFNVGNLFTFSKSNLNFIMLRAALSVVSISLTIFALKYAPISEVYSVFYVYPAVVIILSWILLHEKVGNFDIVCLVSCFIGVILVIRPKAIFPEEASISKPSLFIFGLVILGAFLKAFEDIIIRNVGLEVSSLVVPCIYSIVGILLYPIPMGLTIENKNYVPYMDYIDLLLIFFIALFSFVYQVLMALAIQSENAGRVAMINYFQVFFMFLSDLFIFDRKMIVLDIIGTFIIFGFNFANGLNKTLKRNDLLQNYKKKFSDNPLNKLI